MDGNPNVGAETIRATLARHLELAVRRYREELRGLHQHLSQSTGRVAIDDAVLARAEDYAHRLPTEDAAIPVRTADMAVPAPLVADGRAHRAQRTRRAARLWNAG